jgi:putative transposase
VDSQSIKPASHATEGGFDGGQQVKGRQRQLFVDTLGVLSAGVGTAANTEDRGGLRLLLLRYVVGGARRLRQVGGEGGSQAEGLTPWVRDLKPSYKIDLAVPSHAGKGFQGVPWRGAVERTLAWLLTERRQSREYEPLTANSEALIQLSMIRLLLNRLA